MFEYNVKNNLYYFNMYVHLLFLISFRTVIPLNNNNNNNNKKSIAKNEVYCYIFKNQKHILRESVCNVNVKYAKPKRLF